MHRLRRSKRFAGANAAIDTATDTRAWRSNQTARNRTDPGHGATDKSNRASGNGNTANKSDRSAGKCRHSPGNAIADAAGG